MYLGYFVTLNNEIIIKRNNKIKRLDGYGFDEMVKSISTVGYNCE